MLWFRSVGHSHNAFVMETLIDELATRANADPIAYRQSLLSPDAKKLKACLALLQEKTASWRARVPRDHAVGIACHESFETGVACAVEVSIEDSRPRIHRATIAVDPGFAVNPLTIESQMQGGVSFGITQLVPRYKGCSRYSGCSHCTQQRKAFRLRRTAGTRDFASYCQCAVPAHRQAISQTSSHRDLTFERLPFSPDAILMETCHLSTTGRLAAEGAMTNPQAGR